MQQANSDGSIDACEVWTFWLAISPASDVPIYVASPATGSLQGSGITATDAGAIQNEQTLTQAVTDVTDGQQVTATVQLAGPETECGYSYPNDVTSVRLTIPLQAVLKQVLKPAGGLGTSKAILSAGGYTFPFAPPSAGKLTLRWSATVHGKRTLIASAAVVLSGAPRQSVKVKLTKAGRTQLKAANEVRIVSTATFVPADVPADGTAGSRTATFVLKR